jgi:hypothetical protein
VTYNAEVDLNPAGAAGTRAHTIDVSGFAFNSSILWDPERWGRPTSLPDTSQVSSLSIMLSTYACHTLRMSIQSLSGLHVWCRWIQINFIFVMTESIKPGFDLWVADHSCWSGHTLHLVIWPDILQLLV